MSTLTIRLPDDKHERLKASAKSNSISINKLMDELATVALANYDARVRFEIARGAWQSQARASPARQARSARDRAPGVLGAMYIKFVGTHQEYDVHQRCNRGAPRGPRPDF